MSTKAEPGATNESGTRAPGREWTYDQLRVSEEKYRQLFELESDAVWLVDNETERILEANAASAALYGYTREELLTMKATLVSAEPEKTRQAMREGRSRITVRTHRKKDGTLFPVEISASYFQRQGRSVHIAAIRDITARTRAEEAMRESERRMRSMNSGTGLRPSTGMRRPLSPSPSSRNSNAPCAAP